MQRFISHKFFFVVIFFSLFGAFRPALPMQHGMAKPNPSEIIVKATRVIGIYLAQHRSNVDKANAVFFNDIDMLFKTLIKMLQKHGLGFDVVALNFVQEKVDGGMLANALLQVKMYSFLFVLKSEHVDLNFAHLSVAEKSVTSSPLLSPCSSPAVPLPILLPAASPQASSLLPVYNVVDDAKS